MLETLFPLIHYDIYFIISASTLLCAFLYVQLIEQSLGLDSNYHQQIALGEQFLKKFKYHKALEHFHNAIELAPTETYGYYYKAICYDALGKSNLALNNIDKVFSINPDSIKAKQFRGDIFLKMGDYEKAHIDFEYIIRNGFNQNVQDKLLIVHQLQKDYENMVWLLDHNNDCSGALNLLTTLLNYSPYNINLKERKAKCLVAMGSTQAAIQEYKSISNLLPDDTSYIYKASQELFNIGEFDQSMDEIRKCLKADPDSKLCFPFYKQLKKILNQFKDIDDKITKSKYSECLTAIKEFRNYIQNEDKTHKILNILYPRLVQKECICLAKQGHEKAMDKCNEAIKIEPDNIESLLARADMFMDNNQNDEAKADYEKVKQIDPSESRAEEGLNKIKNAAKRKELKDYYGILGVKKSASNQEINRAYRKLARKWHPDMNKGNPKLAEKKFQELSDAKEILTNSEKRKLYDQGIDPNKPEQQNHQGQTFFFHNGGGDFFNSFDGFPFNGQGFQFQFNFG